METFINAVQYYPKEPQIPATYRCDQLGRDWYETYPLFAPDTLKIVTRAVHDDEIISRSWDASALAPQQGACVYEMVKSDVPVEFLQDDDFYGKWIFRNGKLIRISPWEE